MLRTITTVCILVFTLCSTAQTKFIETYGGPESDMARGVAAVPNGYLMLGSSMNNTNGQYDMYVCRSDAQGDLVWETNSGMENCDQGMDLSDLGFGFYVGTGSTIPPGRTDQDMYFGAIGLNGTVDLQMLGSSEHDEIATGAELGIAGGYVICGHTNASSDGRNDIALVQLMLNGTIEWEQTYSMPNDQEAMAVVRASSQYIIVGRTYDPIQREDMIIISTDVDGNLLWTTTLGDTLTDMARSAVPGPAGTTAVICGYTTSYGAIDSSGVINEHLWVVHCDTNGDTLWTTTVGDTLTHRRANDIVRTSDGYVVCGTFREENTQALQAYWVKLDFNGELVWERFYNNSQNDVLNAVAVANDGGYILSGWTFGPDSYDVLLIKTDQNGNPD